ncbi:MAG TPA: methyltransferase domain-containing protein, partial [Acidimicrobiales bacterium]|nr:methyltransferase domain-containing protein [Acidimicrobiales bacterium]
ASVNIIGRTHGRLVHQRRVRVLASRLARLLPNEGTVLDIGCGDGLLDKLIMESHPNVEVHGIDVAVRPEAHVPVELFDGTVIPHPAGSFDVALLVDVVHHADHPAALLAEAARVGRSAVIVKDHLSDAWLADERLRLMDQIGNRAHGVSIPYNYWSSDEWSEAFTSLSLEPTVWETELHLYPPVIDWIFGRSLHFITRLEREAAS